MTAPPTLKSALALALVQQVLVFGFLMLALCADGGAMFLKTLYAFVAYWVATGILVLRRRRSLTRGDLAFAQFGFLGLFALSFVAAPLVWQLRGVAAGSCG